MDALYRLSYRSNRTGVDSQIRTDDIPGLQSGALDHSAMSTNSAGRQPECARRTSRQRSHTSSNTRYLAEGTGTDPEAISHSKRLAGAAHP
jgi:hypothetical protein